MNNIKNDILKISKTQIKQKLNIKKIKKDIQEDSNEDTSENKLYLEFKNI